MVEYCYYMKSLISSQLQYVVQMYIVQAKSIKLISDILWKFVNEEKRSAIKCTV